MPAAGPDEEGGRLLSSPVLLALRAGESQAAAKGGDQIRLALDDVHPGRRKGVLEVGHEDAGAGVERVDHHLALDRAGDLHPPVGEVRRRRRDLPGRVADRGGVLQETEADAAGEVLQAAAALQKEILAGRADLALEVGYEAQRLG